MKSRRNLFRELWILQFENYKRDIFNLFSGWVITLVILIVWLTFRDTSIQSDPFVLASAIGIIVIRNCSFNFTRTIFNFKETKFFTRIFNTRVSITYVFFLIFLFNQITNFMTSIIFFGIGMLYQDQRERVGDINWLMFITGYVLLALMSNFIGFILGFTIKTMDIALTVANIFYFGSIYFLGLGFPWTIVSQYKGFVITSYFFPQRYAINIMAAGWINRPDMRVNENISFGFGEYNWLPYLISIIFILIGASVMSYLLIKEYSFGNKKIKVLNQSKKHLAIIKQIRKAKSFEELEKINLERKELNNEATKNKNSQK